MLTDACVQTIYENNKEHLTEGNFYDGLTGMIENYK